MMEQPGLTIGVSPFAGSLIAAFLPSLLVRICSETMTVEGYGLQPVRKELLLVSGFSR
jgi:hypothetical protein